MVVILTRSIGRFAIITFALLWIFFSSAFLRHRYSDQEWYLQQVEKLKGWTSNHTDNHGSGESPISYNLNVPPKAGCEDLVDDLRIRLIREYSKMLKGIRHVNIWGYLETENKGDAAIWTAQQMLLTEMGIDTHEACRYLHKDCDVDRFRAAMEYFKPYSAIMMAGGGNFNDYYWDDQPSRIAMIDNFHEFPIRAFPQSVHMTNFTHIQETRMSFGVHPNLQIAARDKPSHDWMVEHLSDESLGNGNSIKTSLLPDIAFMWGSRPDFRTETEKTVDILILSRDDAEISAGNSTQIPFGTGVLDIGGSIGNVTYNKVDWKYTHTPGIDNELPKALKYHFKHQAELAEENKERPQYHLGQQQEMQMEDTLKDTHKIEKRAFSVPSTPEFVERPEHGRNQRAWAKAIAGFEMLGSAKFIITDRLHGHILSTVIGTPHVLMDSKLGKNLNFHDTWTADCECTKIAPDFNTALQVARMYLESQEWSVAF